jgi:uncharacterized protein YbjQ (UPF0145 family)
MKVTCSILALAALALGGCAPFVEQVDLKHATPTERDGALAVRIFEGGSATPKIIKRIGDVDSYSCKHLLTDPPASKGNALQQLRLKASRMGANAVVEVVFDTRGTDTYGTNCWQTVHAAGIAATVAEQ